MKNILEICKEVADIAATARPTSLADASSQQDQIFLSVAKSELQSLLRYGDWQECTKEGYLRTVKGKTQYMIADFCPDFYCLVNNTVFIKDAQEQIIGSITPERWMREKYLGDAGTNVKFKIQNGKFEFLTEPPAGVKIVFQYRSGNVVYDPVAGWAEKPTITKDTDVPIFDEYLVSLGILWRWLKRNGMDYTEEFNEYQRELAKRYADGLATQDINLAGAAFGDDLDAVFVNPAKAE